MENTYKKSSKIRTGVKYAIACLCALYVSGMDPKFSYHPTTGHLSADITTGITQPRALEKLVLNWVNKK